jgi:hypothetical protein
MPDDRVLAQLFILEITTPILLIDLQHIPSISEKVAEQNAAEPKKQDQV